MKKTIATLALLSLSSSAFAMHAYGTDDCIAKLIGGQTLEIDLANGEPANSHRIVNDSSDTIFFVNYDRIVDGNDVNPKDASLVLLTKSEGNIVKRKVDDGCFQGEESTFTRSVVVDSIDSIVKENYELKKGQKIHFVCRSSYSAPTGNGCNK
jgi:hypothetical protein